MKKAVLFLSIIIAISINATAQISITNDGIFDLDGQKPDNRAGTEMPYLLNEHGLEGNQDGNFAPLGCGTLLLMGFGAAYALKKKRH